MAGAENKMKHSKDSKSEESEQDQNVVSMLEVLEEEEQLEDDASAVLGGSDANNCTYDMGYVARQALYACTTCSTPDRESAGVCLACSYECHEGHDLIELYTKRNFRCDCGNSKFDGLTCKLKSDKDSENEKNCYNQNFKGKYCTCSRPYPDPEDEVEDEMIQCVLCEDWYHGRHLGSSPPESESYDEMICNGCMTKYPFLFAYTVLQKATKVDPTEETSPVKVSSPKKRRLSGNQPRSPKTENTTSDVNTKPVIKTPPSDPSEACSSAGDTGSSECKLKLLQARDVKTEDGAVFWPPRWRTKLCKCDSCLQMYEDKKISFLNDDSDTIRSYEEQGKERRRAQGSHYDRGMEALSSMGRTQQVEMLHGYNDLKTELKDYLKQFAENKKVVREEDIKEFFSGMLARKRQRVSGSSMQYFCK